MKSKLGNKSVIIIIWGVLILALTVLIAVFYTKSVKPTDKIVVTGYACWREYTFEEAIEDATTIVYGKVKKKSDTKVHKYPNSDGSIGKEYYRELTVEAISLIKGDTHSKRVKYIEMGGETASPINIGEEHVFFLNEHGAFLSPDTVPMVENGIVLLKGRIQPSDIKLKLDANSGVPVEDYLDAIRAVIE